LQKEKQGNSSKYKVNRKLMGDDRLFEEVLGDSFMVFFKNIGRYALLVTVCKWRF
jgi:hypothetical protein